MSIKKFSIAVITLGFFYSPMNIAFAEENKSSDTYKNLELFGEVFERVRGNYVEEVTDQKLIRAAIRGMLSELDPHSSYLDPENFSEMRVQTRGSFGGLGIEVTTKDGLVKVVSPIDGTPAFRAGIKPGDLITHIDGESILGLPLSDAVEKMRGEVGTKIELTIRREDVDPLKVKITRDIIKIRSVKWEAKKDAAYIRITTFNEQTQKGLKKAIKELKNELGDKMTGIILDLRNNPGGLLDQAISVSDSFLKQGEIVSTRGREAKNTQRVHAKSKVLIDDIPIIVLINSGSASASEIVAGALKDHKRALIIGTRSFGKGSVQTIVPLSDNGAMKLTTAQYYTPSGTSIQGVGITPDIVVEQAKIELVKDKGSHEADLRGSLKNPNNDEDEQEKSENKSDEEEEAFDFQLTRALDILSAMKLYKVQ